MTADPDRGGADRQRMAWLAAAAWVGLAGGVLWLAGRPPAAEPVADADLFREPPVTGPPAVPGADAGLPDDAPVIGVSAGGRHRAYPELAFVPTYWHVVNDQLGGVPVTVTHCPRTGCTRAFDGPAGGRPLGLAVGGWADGGLVLLDPAGGRFPQDTGRPLDGPGGGPSPHPDHPAVRTTSGAWRAAHPDTDLSLGGPRPKGR